MVPSLFHRHTAHAKTNQDTINIHPLRQDIQLKPSFMHWSSNFSTVYYVLALVLCVCASDALALTHTKLYKASVKVERVPDSYFIHFWDGSSPLTIQRVLRELEEQSQDQSIPNFSATVHRVLTLAGNGLAATLSSQAIQYVSSLLFLVCGLCINDSDIHHEFLGFHWLHSCLNPSLIYIMNIQFML